MRRTVTINEHGILSFSGNSDGEVWMTAWEIAELFNVTTTAVKHAIKAVCKQDALNDYEVCRYVPLENGLYADVYSLEVIIPIAFRLNTYYTNVFRAWILNKALSKQKETSYVVFLQRDKDKYC